MSPALYADSIALFSSRIFLKISAAVGWTNFQILSKGRRFYHFTLVSLLKEVKNESKRESLSLGIKIRAAEWNSQEKRERRQWNECSPQETESIGKQIKQDFFFPSVFRVKKIFNPRIITPHRETKSNRISASDLLFLLTVATIRWSR